MDKRFWISGVAMSVAALMLGFVVHGLLLKSDYEALVGTVMRSPEESQVYFHWMLIAHVLIGFSMTWIYRQGFAVGRPPVGQGIRFGLAMALFSTVPVYLIYYVVERLPSSLVQKQIAFDTLAMLLLGVLVAVLNPRPTAG